MQKTGTKQARHLAVDDLISYGNCLEAVVSRVSVLPNVVVLELIAPPGTRHVATVPPMLCLSWVRPEK